MSKEKAPKEVFEYKSTVKMFTKKEVFWKVLPWAIIFTVAIMTTGLAFGWTIRSDFDATIKKEVVNQVSSFTKELEAKQ